MISLFFLIFLFHTEEKYTRIEKHLNFLFKTIQELQAEFFSPIREYSGKALHQESADKSAIFYNFMRKKICLYASNVGSNIPKSLPSSVVSFPFKKIREKKLSLDLVKQDTPLNTTGYLIR